MYIEPKTIQPRYYAQLMKALEVESKQQVLAVGKTGTGRVRRHVSRFEKRLIKTFMAFSNA